MEVRTNRLNKQLLIMKIKEPVCFKVKSFLYRMKRDDYTWVYKHSAMSFSKIMDEDKNFGTVEIFYDLNDSINIKELCVTNFLFDTFKTFDRSKYE